ncbi:MAG: VWA domain-containing protein [Deltaproteobacteria bacterium]|nr:VWA domain-containing protein [Deltaproteobacteria bacterium]
MNDTCFPLLSFGSIRGTRASVDRWVVSASLLPLLLTGQIACSSESRRESPTIKADQTSTGGVSGNDSTTVPLAGSDFGYGGDQSYNSTGGQSSGQAGTTTARQEEEGKCGSIGATAEMELAEVDIIWVVDTSGSMIDETERIQRNMDTFVAEISASGVDTRVVLIAQLDIVPPNSNLAQSGNYIYVNDQIDSHNSLDRIVETFSRYSSFIRETAHVHFIIVSDDESRYLSLQTPEERASQFQSDIEAILDPDFSVHAIASESVGGFPCVPESDEPEFVKCCQDSALTFWIIPAVGCEGYTDRMLLECPFLGGAFAPGLTYYALAANTGGVAMSICQQDWTEVFGSLRDAVIESAPLPCDYAIPPPPEGEVHDFSKVNMKYTPHGVDPATVQPYPRVNDAGRCGNNAAWYYDNNDAPTKIILCPAACERVGSGDGGSVTVLFDCAPVILV